MTMQRVILVGALLTVSTQAFCEGTSPWLPIPGQLSASINYTDQEGDTAYIGDNELDVDMITGGAAEDFERNTTTLTFNYGISDNFALDVTLGYGEVEAGAADSDQGIIDTLVGISWRMTDEFMDPALPTMTLRAGAIINGDYDGGRLAALGRDANGLELSFLIGKSLSSWFALSAEVGVQERDNDVPTAYFYEVSTHFTPAPGWNLSLGYAEKEFDDDLDIGDPGFTPDQFQEVGEERSLLKASVGYGFGNHGVALLYNDLLDGRNTVNDSALSLSYTFAF